MLVSLIILFKFLFLLFWSFYSIIFKLLLILLSSSISSWEFYYSSSKYFTILLSYYINLFWISISLARVSSNSYYLILACSLDFWAASLFFYLIYSVYLPDSFSYLSCFWYFFLIYFLFFELKDSYSSHIYTQAS